MTFRFIALLLFCAACAGPEEWVQEYDGYLPGTAPHDHAVFLVRDGATGAPLPGALIRQHEQDVVTAECVRSPVVDELRTDEFGLAGKRVAPYDGDDYDWVVDAAGFAPIEAYGGYGGEVYDLVRGDQHRGRILGPSGEPVANAVVDYVLDSSSTLVPRSTTTNADGIFRFEGVTEGNPEYWHPLVGAGSASTTTLAGVPIPEECALPGARIEGRIVMSDGTAPKNAVVCSDWRALRPLVKLGRDGSFVLEGLDPRADVRVLTEDERLDVGHMRPGGPITFRIGAAPEPAHNTVTVLVPGRSAEWPLGVAFERTSDGCRPDGGMHGQPIGIPDGEYRAFVGTPFSRYFGKTEVFRVPGTDRVTVELEPQSRVELHWAQEELRKGWVQLNTEGRFHRVELPMVLESEIPYLPPELPATLVVEREGVRRFFPIPHDHSGAGVRRVTVRMPDLKRLKIPDLEHGDVIIHATAATKPQFDDDPEILLARHAGRIAVELKLPNEVRLHWFDLPERDPGTPIRASRVQRHVAPPRRELRVLFASGTVAEGAEVALWTESIDPIWRRYVKRDLTVFEDEVPHSPWFRDGASVRIGYRDSDYVPRVLVLRGDGPYTMRWGDCSLFVDVGPEAASPAVWIDGEMMRRFERGLCRLRGLDAGPHTLIVGAHGRMSKIVRVVLKRGESRLVRVDLPLRTIE